MAFNKYNSGHCITCCFDCPDRHPGCHGTCEKYKKQRAEWDAKKVEQKKQADAKYGLNSFYFDSVHKSTKRINYRRKYRKGH